jgi:hypothetical protein
MWVGELILDIKQPILIVAENDEKVEESIIRLLVLAMTTLSDI